MDQLQLKKQNNASTSIGEVLSMVNVSRLLGINSSTNSNKILIDDFF